MAGEIPRFPPFDFRGEKNVVDNLFENECAEALEEILEVSDMEITSFRMTKNKEFGFVCRYDFDVLDSEGVVNRIMFWKLPDGQIANFIGFDLPTIPLADMEDELRTN